MCFASIIEVIYKSITICVSLCVSFGGSGTLCGLTLVYICGCGGGLNTHRGVHDRINYTVEVQIIDSS